MNKIRFVIVGGGWRSEFFLRVARELPDRFSVEGMHVRRAERGAELERAFGVKTYRTLDELLAKASFEFAIVSVPWEACPGIIAELAAKDIPVLAETPPAPDIERLTKLNGIVENGGKVQAPMPEVCLEAYWGIWVLWAS